MKQGILEEYGIYSDLDEVIQRFSIEAPKFYPVIETDTEQIYQAFYQTIIHCIDKDKIFHENKGKVTTGEFCDEFIIERIL